MLGYILATPLSQNDLNEPAASNCCFQWNINFAAHSTLRLNKINLKLN